ncbi:MAG: SDR family NAD(P)-dependent oxidoreductase [Acidimicrobiales bacterium]|nr:SDR family NAD(P)-dependent oxidoreductase [Acidimicrobiales bacterium]
MGRRFDGQAAVVTGAGGGLGREYALLLAAEGAQVVVNDYGGDRAGTPGSVERAEEVVHEIRSAGGTAVADGCDIAVGGSALIELALETFGGVHIIINNAGIAGGGAFDDIDPSAFDRMLDVHLGGTAAVTRAAWPVLRDQGYGRIINTSSASVFGMPGTSAYITAKAAVFGLTRALGREGRRHGIAVNAVMPTAYSRLTAASPFIGRLMEVSFPASAVAPFVVALASTEVRFTGETFVVGGGRAARVVLQTVPGAAGLDTIDDCIAAFDQVLALDDAYLPSDATDALRYECGQLGIDLDEFFGR